MRRFKAGDSSEGVRADVFLASKFPAFTRSSLSALFDQHQVKINGKIAKAGRKLHFKDSLAVDDALLNAQPASLDLPIIYEDADVVVVNKPSGVLTHSKGALNSEATIASSLRSKIDPELTSNRAGVVHRLDRGTSGVIILAKTVAALAYLQKQFANRSVEKAYLAIVEGRPQPAEALIDAPIGRNSRQPQTFNVVASGKPAKTHYRVKNSFKKGKQDYSLLELWPMTGRTHQIRVHLKYIDHPVCGDRTYGHGDGLLLHAASLSLSLPSGKKMKFRVLPPAKFKEFLDARN